MKTHQSRGLPPNHRNRFQVHCSLRGIGLVYLGFGPLSSFPGRFMMDQSVFDTLRGSTHLQCWGVPKEDLQLREMPPYFGSLSNRCPSPSAQTVRTGGTSQTYSGTASRVSRLARGRVCEVLRAASGCVRFGDVAGARVAGTGSGGVKRGALRSQPESLFLGASTHQSPTVSRECRLGLTPNYISVHCKWPLVPEQVALWMCCLPIIWCKGGRDFAK